MGGAIFINIFYMWTRGGWIGGTRGGVYFGWLFYGAQNFVAGTRIDDNEQFGMHTTGNVDYALDLISGHRLNMGYGTAFKSPSFNDLYYPGFGTPTLDVETSSSFEIGLSGDSYRGHWSIRGFQTRIEDLIGYDPVTWASVNVDKARINGFEFEWDGLVRAGLLKNWEMGTSLNGLKKFPVGKKNIGV